MEKVFSNERGWTRHVREKHSAPLVPNEAAVEKRTGGEDVVVMCSRARPDNGLTCNLRVGSVEELRMHERDFHGVGKG